MRFILLFLVCASMLGFRVVRAENVYVSPTGTGASDGSRSTPFSSLKTAMSRISPGDTLWLSEGRYEEPLKLVQKKGIRILPVEGAAVVIDGTVEIPKAWVPDGNGVWRQKLESEPY